MASGKLTPRQKMINMMYLVLTALLALNVSKDILNAFIIVNDGIVITSKHLTRKNSGLIFDFEKAMMDDPIKVKPWLEKAKEARKLSGDMCLYLKTLASELIQATDGVEKVEADTIVDNLYWVTARDNYDIPMSIMCGSESDGSNGKARELKNKLTEYKTKMLALVGFKPDDKRAPNLGLDTRDQDNPIEGKQPWEMATFFHTVLVADVVILNKLIVEVKNAEADILTRLKEKITAEDFKFDCISAKVIPKSNYVLTGEKYEADIFVAAYNSTQAPNVIIKTGVDTIIGDGADGQKIEGSKGLCKYEAAAGGEGLQKYAGIINIKKPDGSIQGYHFKNEYVVARPAATVSADAMNVLYVGLDNPISISVPGVPTEKVRANMTGGGTLRAAGKGKFIATVSNPGSKVKINVSADLGGTSKNMGSMEYRIKKVPDHVAIIAGVKSGSVNKNQVVAAPYITAQLENFVFEGVKYTVTGFLFSTMEGTMLKEYPCSGNKLSAGAISAVQKARSGQKLFFENIKAKGPDGTSRSLPSVILRIQ
ncbi:MAG: gliding motility protein GldM [Bacteroidota bacterium]